MLPDIRSTKRTVVSSNEQKSSTKLALQDNSLPITNPFNFPFDADLITLKQEHLQRLHQQKQDEKAKPLWQKGIKDTGNEVFAQIKELKERIEHPPSQNRHEEPDILKAADAMLKDRPRKRDNIHDFINRKKEMFLIQMKISQKRDQIRWFEERTSEKSEKLHVIENRMKEDLDQFNQFVEFNKLQTNEQIKAAENETKEKLAVINKIKSLGEIKTTKLNFNLKLLEKLNNLLSYKQFLDTLTPASVLDTPAHYNYTKAEDLEEPIKTKPNELHSSSLDKRRFSKTNGRSKDTQGPNDLPQPSIESKSRKDTIDINDQTSVNSGFYGSNVEESNLSKTNRSSFREMAKRGKNAASRRKNENSASNYQFDVTDQKLMQMIEQLGSKTHNGLIQLIRSNNISFQIYFKSPNELLDIYKEIEEENLRLIKETQKLKTKSEDLEEEMTRMRFNFENDQTNLLKNREELIRRIKDTKANLSKNLTYTSENINEIEQAIKAITNKINSLAGLVDLKTKASPFEILKELEAKISRDLQKINELDPELVRKYAKIILEDKKQQYVREIQEQEKQNDLKKVNKIRSKASKRSQGRKDVWRSYLKNKAPEVSEVVVDQNLATENDKYFF
jgi:hypothetical protein